MALSTGVAGHPSTLAALAPGPIKSEVETGKEHMQTPVGAGFGRVFQRFCSGLPWAGKNAMKLICLGHVEPNSGQSTRIKQTDCHLNNLT